MRRQVDGWCGNGRAGSYFDQPLGGEDMTTARMWCPPSPRRYESPNRFCGGGHHIRAVVMSSLESPLRLPEPQFVVWVHGQTT